MSTIHLYRYAGLDRPAADIFELSQSLMFDNIDTKDALAEKHGQDVADAAMLTGDVDLVQWFTIREAAAFWRRDLGVTCGIQKHAREQFADKRDTGIYHYVLGREEMASLIKTMKDVLEARSPELAAMHFPAPKSVYHGFLGRTPYTDDYFDNLRNSHIQLLQADIETDYDTQFFIASIID